MANWTGTYTNTTPTGTSSGGNTSTTFNDTTASWPAANGLTNFTVRILAGTGAGQTAIVSTNSATAITIASTWSVTPDATSAYEIVLLLLNNDHFTATTTFGAGIITEIQDSANILFDGSYILNIVNSCTVRWNKSPTTIPWFQANNRTVQGTFSFWQYVFFQGSLSVTPNVSYIKITDTAQGMIFGASTGLGDASTVHHLWTEVTGATSSCFDSGTYTIASNSELSGLFTRGSSGTTFNFNNTVALAAFSQGYTNCWAENATSQGIGFLSTTGATTQYFKNSVFLNALNTAGTAKNAIGQTYSLYDCYWSGPGTGGLLGNTSLAATGTYNFLRNVCNIVAALFGAGVSTATQNSNFNDYGAVNLRSSSFPAINNAATNNYSAGTSDNDYIAGTASACPQNVDTSSGVTTSTASPVQYKNLPTNRTNAKAVRNRPYVIDNVVIGTPTTNSVTITFDCQNGAVAGQGSTTVNVDSNSGQAVLSVASTTGFSVGETVEIGYGTARYETPIISSISAGVSLTMTTNLAFTHTAAQADTVKKRLRHIALPFIKYGVTSGVRPMESAIPQAVDRGLIYTGIVPTIGGVSFAYQYVGHSVTLINLMAGTTYFFMPFGADPLGNVLSGSESSFTTASLSVASTFG